MGVEKHELLWLKGHVEQITRKLTHSRASPELAGEAPIKAEEATSSEEDEDDGFGDDEKDDTGDEALDDTEDDGRDDGRDDDVDKSGIGGMDGEEMDQTEENPWMRRRTTWLTLKRMSSQYRKLRKIVVRVNLERDPRTD